jgi:putative membrane protein
VPIVWPKDSLPYRPDTPIGAIGGSRMSFDRYLVSALNRRYIGTSMIVRDHLPWMQVWPQISHKLALLFVFDTTVAIIYVFGGAQFLALPSLPLGMVGAALSIFLAFRTNSAYDRWWEARTLWGGLVNYSRTIARQALTLIQGGPEEANARAVQRKLIALQICYVHALRCHLRNQNPFPELRNRLDPEMLEALRQQKNVPSALLLQMGKVLEFAAGRGWLDSYRWTAVDNTLTELTNIQGACERIKNTPLPKQYDYFPRLLVTLFCFMLPFGLVEGLGLLTPLASASLSFIFITLDRIGRDIETPFENTVHDTPMTSLSRTIEINLRQLMGESHPNELQPVAGYMY